MALAGEEESSSGCQSGWTVYFDHSHLALPPCNKHVIQFEETSKEEEEEEEEDLSMVSDASSGPPHFEQPSESGTLLFFREGTKKRKADWLSETKRDLCSSLNDTASSPLFKLNHSSSTGAAITDINSTAESALEFSCAFSEEESQLMRDTSYLQPIPSLNLPKAE